MTQLASLLEAQSTELMAKWLEKVRHDIAPGGKTTVELRDHLPRFLRELIASLRAGKSTTSAGPARAHGRQRYRLGFDLEMLVREYAILRDVIFDAAQFSDVSVEWTEIRRLADFISEAVAEGVAQYNQDRVKEQKEAAEAALKTVKEREKRLATLAESLRLSEERLRRVVDAAGTGTWDYDVATGVFRTDARMNELMGLPVDAPFTLELGLQALPFEADKQLVRDSIMQALAGEEEGHYHVEFRTGGSQGVPLVLPRFDGHISYASA